MKNDDSDEAKSCLLFRLGSRISCRRVLNIMVFLGFMVNYMLRVNLTFAIVYMVLSNSNDSSNIGKGLSLLSSDNSNDTSLNRTRRYISSDYNSGLEGIPSLLNYNDDGRYEMLPNPSALLGFGKNKETDTTTTTSNDGGGGGLVKRLGHHLVRSGSRTFEKHSSSHQADNNNNKNYIYGDDFALSTATASSETNAETTTKTIVTTPISKSSERNIAAGNLLLQPDQQSRSSTDTPSRIVSADDSIVPVGKTENKSKLSNAAKTTNDDKVWFSSNDVDDNKKEFNPSVLSDNLLANEANSTTSGGINSTTANPIVAENPPAIDSNLSANSKSVDSTSLSLPSTSSSSSSLDDVKKNRLPLEPEPESTATEAGDIVKDDQLDVISPPEELNTGSINSDYLKSFNKFTWSEKKQGFLLGSFFWGYVCTELPGGRLAELIGARSVFGYATLGASVVTLLTPLSAKINFFAVAALRIVLGILLGPTWPSVLPLAAKWIPPNERGKFMSNMMASTLGAAFTLPVCSFIIETSSWEYVFYVTGLIGFFWSLCWFVLIYDSPAKHPRITAKEREYIETQMKMGLKLNRDPEKYDGNNSPYGSDSEDKPVVVAPLTAARRNSDQLLPTNTDNGNGPLANENNDSPPAKTSSEDGAITAVNESDTTRNNDEDKRSSPIKVQINPVNAEDTGNNDSSSKANYRNSNSHIAVVLNRNGSLTSSSRSKFSTRKDNDGLTPQKTSHPKAPWLKIATSLPVWAFVVTHTASVFGYNTITVQLPTYMKHILHYDIKSNGILSSLPYLGKYVMAILAGSIADNIVKANVLSKTTIRKIFTALAVLVPGCLMLLQVYLGEDKIMSIVIFTAALTINGLVTGGYLGNALDLAPNYSGTIFGLGNMFSSGGGAVSALIVGFLTNDNQVYGQWQIVFWIVGFVYICGATFFLLFGTAETQSWDSPDANKSKDSADTNGGQINSFSNADDITSDYGSMFFDLFYGKDYDRFYAGNNNVQKWV